MIDKNWIRWIRIGIRKHFDSVKESYHLHFEGMDRDELAALNEYAECRVDGPDTRFYSGLARLDIDVNIILTVKYDSKDLDRIYRISGVFHSGFLSGIPIYKLGGGPEDDGELLGCLQMSDKVKYSYFGIVDKDTRPEQASLLARYHLEL